MASILVVGQEQRSLERFHRVLSAEGWRVRVAQGRAQALQAAASERPDLVLAAAEVPGAEELASAFLRSAGGPGIVVVLPEGVPAGPALSGDDHLSQPFGDDELVLKVRRLLLSAQQPSDAPAAPTVRLTSQDIFGDVLAEVEGQLGGRTPFPPTPPGVAAAQAAQSANPAKPPAAAVSVASPPFPAAPRAPASRDDGDIQRKLEKTLSGMLNDSRADARAARLSAAGSSPASAAGAGAAGPRRSDAGGGRADVDALLSRTLSELGARPRTGTTAHGVVPGSAPSATLGSPGSSGSSGSSGSAPVPDGAPVAARPGALPSSPAPVATGSPLPVLGASPSPLLGTRPASPPPAPPALPVPGNGPQLASAQPGASVVSAPASPATDGTGVRRRFTGELDLSQLEDLARTRRKVEPASRPLSSSLPASALPSQPQPGTGVSLAPVSSLPAMPPMPPTPSSVAENPAATQRIQMVPREAGEPAGERFGQYTLLERIAMGGMAEVWKARMRGVEGFQKTVAIKKILPYMTDNADFVGMFIDEAKFAAQLSHPNIIHIYDLGKIGADFYIAMEYVEGKDLRSLLNAARQRGLPLPLGLALLIALRLASALDYAHRKRDFEGREMGLVHRDVSPQNVLISYDGDVKLCDFGIAKAVSKVGQTEMGALKGKLQYMSPEQARGVGVDGRSDIFSLGTVLFEMLTGERLFEGDSEMSVLEAVRQVRVRSPRQVNPSIPPEVDAIVMRALAGRPEDRFQNAGELEQRLEAVLYALKPSPTHSELASYVRHVLDKPAPAGRPDRFQPSSAPAPAATDMAASAATGASGAPTPGAPGAEAPALHGGGPQVFPPSRPAALPPPAGASTGGSSAAALTAAATAAATAPMGPMGPMGVAAVAPTQVGQGAVAPPAHAPWASTPPTTLVPPAFADAAQPADAAPHYQDVTPLASLGDVPAEDGSRRGRLLLLGAILLLLVIAVVAYFFFGRRTPAAPVPPAAPAQTPGAGAPGPGAARVNGQPGSPASAANPAAGAAGAVGGTGAAGKIDVNGLVDQELQRRADAMKKKFEDQQKQLQKELDKTKAAKSAAETPVAAPPGGAQPVAAQALHGGPTSAGGPAGAETRAGSAADSALAPTAAAPPAVVAPAPAAVAPPAERPSEPPSRSNSEPPPAGGTSSSAGGAADSAVAGAGRTVPPTLVSSIKPEYPPVARKLHVEGVVVVSVLVDEQGHVEDVRLLEPISQNVGINEAALQVARAARFKPAVRDGARIKMWTRLRIPFKL